MAETGSIDVGERFQVVGKRGKDLVARRTDASVTSLKELQVRAANSHSAIAGLHGDAPDAEVQIPSDEELLGTAAEDLGIESLEDEEKH